MEKPKCKPGSRPFRTVVSAPIEQLLAAYNDAAEQLRPIVAQIFNVPELIGPPNSVTAAADQLFDRWRLLCCC